MEDFKIYIFAIWKISKYTYSLYKNVSLVYNLHIEKSGICLIFFFKSNAVSFRCFVDNFDVLSTKEQLVDDSLGEAFLGGPQTPRHARKQA